MAKYQELYHLLLSKIVNGEYAVGDRLPSSMELAQKQKVSYLTAHKVYELLVRNRMAEARRGKGFFVSESQRTIFTNNSSLSVGKVGMMLSFGNDDVFNESFQLLVSRLLQSGIAPTALGYSWGMEDLSFEACCATFRAYAEAGIRDLIVRGDPHFPYRALNAVRDCFEKIIFVMFYSGEFEIPGVQRIVFDMHKAGEMAAEHMFKSGFDRLVFLTQEPAAEVVRRKHGVSLKLFDLDMLDGVVATAARHGVDFSDAGLVIVQNMPYGEREAEVRRQLTAAFDAGANGFIGLNDNRLLLVYQIAIERGLVPGRDFGAIGCFNTPLGAQLYPPLSSIDLNPRLLVERIIEAQRGGGVTNGKAVYIEPKLIKRR